MTLVRPQISIVWVWVSDFFFFFLLSVPLFIGHDKRSDSSWKSGSAKSFAVLRKHSWQTGMYSSIFFKVHLYMSFSAVNNPPNAPLMSQSLEHLAVQTTHASSNPPPWSFSTAATEESVLSKVMSARSLTDTCRTKPAGWMRLNVHYFGITLARIHRHPVCGPADSLALLGIQSAQE